MRRWQKTDARAFQACLSERVTRTTLQFMINNIQELKRIEKILEQDFKDVRDRIKKAMNSCPKSTTLKEALEQMRKFRETTQARLAEETRVTV